MRVYWDSSALLNALAGNGVVSRFQKGEHVTRSDAFVEAFHHLTGRGLPSKGGVRQKVTPTDVARMIRTLAAKLDVRDLDVKEVLRALDDAQSAGVMGKNVHDWMHARAAKLANCDLVLTRDEDFVPLSKHEGITTDWP
jgi:predicted nucleic acid-binding protein